MSIEPSLVWEFVDMTVEPEEVYHSREEVSTSQVKDFLKGPEYYHGRVIAKTMPMKDSPSLELGKAVHEDVLSAGMSRGIVIIPESALASNGHRRGKAWEQFVAENAGRILMKPEEAEQFYAARDAVLQHPEAARILQSGHSETTFLFKVSTQDGEHLANYRMRLDYIKPGEVVADIKTTREIADKFVRYAIDDFYYAEQAAAYKFGADLAFGANHDFVFIFTHTKPPMMSRLWRPKLETLRRGFARIESAILEISERRKSGNWVADDWLDIREF